MIILEGHGTRTEYQAGCRCNPCRAAWSVYQKESRDRRKPILREIIVGAKNCPCHDCGNQYPPYVMQFDHINSDKEFNVSMATSWLVSETRLRAEIAKCEVVCANCHAIRTWKRRNS